MEILFVLLVIALVVSFAVPAIRSVRYDVYNSRAKAALKKLGTSKSRTLVAEDALYAVKTAKKAGFLTAGVAETRSADDQPALFREADYYILSFLEIKLP